MSANLLIEASAGTGKTQALGERLIQLLREGVKPQEIVALTFSRAAAGEIFERFVSLLAKGAAGNADDARLLRSVIATQHLSQIGTLDSFLMRIVRAFPLELGLVGDLEILDESAEAGVRAAVSFSILRRTDAQTKRAFVDAFALAMNREDVRSFVDSYRAFIKSWHGLCAALPDERAWGDPERIWGTRPAFAAATERELKAAADSIRGISDADAWRDFADWIRDFRGRLGTPKGIAKKLLDSDTTFEGDVISFTFNRKPYPLGREETQLVRTALLCVFGYIVRMKLELARGIYRLISAYERDYDAKVRRTGKLVFSDVPRLIAALPEDRRLALEYRMDAKIRAWALDEFQDTSREQWAAIENLIGESLQSDDGKSVFVVGDTKQAIYGWRNGDVGIFRRQRESGLYGLGERNLTYRSGPAVVEAVNRVFARGRIFEEFPAWRCPEHATARPEMKGFVRVEDALGRKMEDFLEPVRVALAAALGAKADDPRRRGVSAAVLVRGNAFGELLADGLKAGGFEGVVWEGESAILDTPALSGFLDLLQLADHPGDALTYRHFKLTPLAAAKYPDGVPAATEVSREFALLFTTRGIVRTLRELRACLPSDPAEAWSRFTEERFTDMLRAAERFELERSAGTRLADFKGFLEAQKKRTVAEPGKVKVMTIHRSKGLGFDYVVLPLYEYDSLTSESDGPLVGDGWILPDPGAKAAKAVGGLEAAYRLRKDRAEQEALCVYYVAMTRAKSGLTIVCQPATQTGTSLRFSDLVRSAELGSLADGELERPAAEAPRAAEKRPLLAGPGGPRVRLRRRLPSLGFAGGQSAGSLFAGEAARTAARQRGTEAHAAWERVEWIDPSAATNGFERALVKPEGVTALWRERAFEVFADGEWTSGRFDRVVFAEGGAVVQDFKTNAPLRGEGAADFEARMRSDYAPQMRAYRKAVASLTGLPDAKIRSELLLSSTGAVLGVE